MLSLTLALLGGLVLLVAGADQFVKGAAGTAGLLRVPPLVIGIVVVGIGTSAPEVLISGFAAWNGNSALGVGNALGSNITNVALVLGLTAVICPLAVHSQVLRREFPLLLSIMGFALLLLLDGEFERIDGILLLTGFVLLLAWLVYDGLRSRETPDPLYDELTAELPPPMPATAAALRTLVGLAGLLIGARLMVWGAVGVAEQAGLSELVIGLSIVAIGTSLPELAASLTGALKGEDDIAVGNVLGSNLFNLLAVLGMPGLLHPAPIDPELLWRDFPVMIALTVALYLMCRPTGRIGRINRLEGSLLLLCFVGYQTLLFRG